MFYVNISSEYSYRQIGDQPIGIISLVLFQFE